MDSRCEHSPGRTTARLLMAAAVWAALLLAGMGTSRAGDWPGWRGPTGAGHTSEKDLPLTWGGKNNENVLWKVTLVGRGYSSPIVCAIASSSPAPWRGR